ncbi:MAG: hypothetical protein HY706_18615, partial [Candidatus Hydrogenedentes bacterium]|nr:hypothetical protein [Candidatus Hydrogenedentota bacterium]
MSGDSTFRKAIPGRPFLSFFNYARPYWRRFLAGSALSVVFMFVGLIMPVVLRAVVNRLEAGTITHPLLWEYFAVLLGTAIVTGIARYWQRTWMIGASRR